MLETCLIAAALKAKL